MRKNILVTGGAGFIASNFVHFWSSNHPDDNLVILDSLTYAGNLKNIKDLINNKRINFVEGDITDKKNLELLLIKFSINIIINFAAESHVDRSISNPSQFIHTNILGTYVLLDTFKNYWKSNGSNDNWRFIQISTDEVFGSLGFDEKSFDEHTSYSPRSPYSASKASGDHLAMSWFHTYGLPVILSNCSNNYGPFQYPEKLIPKTIINIILGYQIPVYGKGLNIRDWLYVDDHIFALEKIIFKGVPGERYCIGGENEINNLNLVELICDIATEYKISHKKINYKELIQFIEDRPGHDLRYSINSSFTQKQLNWSQQTNLEDGLTKTIKWYSSFQDWWKPLLKT